MSKSSRHFETGLLVLLVMPAPPHPLLLTVFSLSLRRSHVLVDMTFKTSNSDVCVLATVQFNPLFIFFQVCVFGVLAQRGPYYSFTS